jgi:hypothetical protein
MNRIRTQHASPPDLEEWLHAGRLTLVGANREAVSATQWPALPSEVRDHAQTEFRRLVGANTKAAVIFLRTAALT